MTSRVHSPGTFRLWSLSCVTVTLEAGGAGTYTQRAIPGSGLFGVKDDRSGPSSARMGKSRESSLQEPHLAGLGDRLAARGDVQLAVDRNRLRLDGVAGQEQLIADLGERQMGR